MLFLRTDRNDKHRSRGVIPAHAGIMCTARSQTGYNSSVGCSLVGDEESIDDMRVCSGPAHKHLVIIRSSFVDTTLTFSRYNTFSGGNQRAIATKPSIPHRGDPRRCVDIGEKIMAESEVSAPSRSNRDKRSAEALRLARNFSQF